MKKFFRLQWEARKNRWRRRAGEVLREIGRSLMLIGAIVLVTAVLLVGYDRILCAPALRIRETVVKGCRELTEKEILTLAAVRSPSNLLTINGDAVARRIRANPWIEEVFVGREFPDRLVIVVRERKSVALIGKDDGLFLLDGRGRPFKKLESGEESDLPVLTGCVRDGVIDEALVKKSLALLNDLAGIKNRPEIGNVSEIHGNETFGFSVFTDTGLCLQLGFDGYEGKLQRLAPVMADLDRKNMKAGFLLIDLSNPAKINVQRRNVLEPAAPKKPAAAGKGYRM
ncbi:MAG: FtsQ-type POTRA domain-containing protein [Deltaproteobacteria bacterium]|nr:FtsQ-type POTRA domain-containing protein [Deltaproteobacteria bacterium]